MSTTYTELADAIDEVGTVPCHSAPDLFFADDQTDGWLTLLQYARKMCVDCPVRNLCADYAITNDEHFGVWGGMSPHERKVIRRRRGIPELAPEPETPAA